MRITSFSFLAAIFTIVFLLMIFTVYLSFKNSNEVLRSHNWVGHTYEVINRLENLQRNLTKTESDIRGFFISRIPEFNDNFSKDTVMLMKVMYDIQELTTDNPAQQAHLTDLKILLQQRIGTMKYVLTSVQKESLLREEAEDLIRKGFRYNKEIYAITNRMIGNERVLLEKRKSILSNKLTRTRVYILFSGIASLPFGLLFMVILRRDLRRRKATERELRKLNENKNRFFSIISHDLRGPVSAARQLTEIITQEEYNLKEEEKHNFTAMLRQSIEKVSVLLNDLLEWSRIQMNNIEFNPENLPLKSIVTEIIDTCTSSARNKQIRLHNLVQDNSDVYGDRYMTSTILRNLLSNSIKFTKENRNIYITSRMNGQQMMEISVRDEGIGISKAIQEKLFKVGEKHSMRGTLQEAGTGMGLILCKEFVEKQGGHIWVESTENQGATFTFTIPVKL